MKMYTTVLYDEMEWDGSIGLTQWVVFASGPFSKALFWHSGRIGFWVFFFWGGGCSGEMLILGGETAGTLGRGA